MDTLIHFNKAHSALAEIATIDEAKNVRDKAEAIRVYLHRIGESLSLQNEAAEIKARAERKGGELLRVMEKAWGNQHAQSHDGTKLTDLGLNKNQSSRWQTIESIPAKVFDRFIEDVKSAGEVLTSSALVQVGELFGVSGRYVDDAVAVKQANPDLHEKVKSGEITLPQAKTKIREAERSQNLRTMEWPKGKYRVIYADPPWAYNDKRTGTIASGSVNFQYNTMTPGDACCTVSITRDVCGLD